MFDELKLHTNIFLSRDSSVNYYRFLKQNLNLPSIEYLEILVDYLLEHEESTRDFVGEIRHCIKNINRHLDETYLLLFEVSLANKKTFQAIPNLKFLNLSTKLIFILEKNNLGKEVHSIHKIQSKVELGFQRYFIHKNKYVYSFTPADKKYKIARRVKLIEVACLIKSTDKGISKEAKEIIKTSLNTREILLSIYFLKSLKDKAWKIELKRLEKYLFYFPFRIIDKKKNIKEIEIEESLFPLKENSFIDIDNNVMVENPNNFEIGDILYKILKDEQ